VRSAPPSLIGFRLGADIQRGRQHSK